MITQKKWGINTQIFCNDTVEVYLAEINKKGYSSKHFHQNKYNVFHLQSGLLIVKIWHDEENWSEVYLHEGERIVVPPNTWHQFLAIKDSKLIEIYYVKISSEDIIRDEN